MKRLGKDEIYPLVLMSREGGSLHGIVKHLVGKYGFLWRKLPNFPLARNASIVLVAPAGDAKMFGALSDKCGVWNTDEQSACACYELEVGNSIQPAVADKDSLTDWISTEYYFYKQNEIGFEGAVGLSEEQLQEFESVLEHTLQELLESFEAKRSNP